MKDLAIRLGMYTHSYDSMVTNIFISCTPNSILLGTATIQFLLAFAFVAYGLRLLVEGFIQAANIPGGVALYWINPSVPSQVASKAIYITNVCLFKFS